MKLRDRVYLLLCNHGPEIGLIAGALVALVLVVLSCREQ